MRVDGAVSALRKNLAGVQTAAVGAVAAFAGFSALRGMWHMVEAGKALNTELTRSMQMGGEMAANIGSVERFAVRLSTGEVPTATPAEIVRLQRELYSQLTREGRNSPLQMAQQLATPFAQFGYVLSNFSGKDTSEQDLLAAWKTIDQRRQIYTSGQIDPKKVEAELDAMSRGIRITGGMLRPQDFQMMMRQAGPAAMNMQPNVAYGLLGELAVAMGPARTGTALMSLFQQSAGGIMTQRVAKELQYLGILQPGDWHPQKGGGGGVVLEREAAVRFGQQTTDPFKFVAEKLVPAMQAHGITGPDMIYEIFRTFGRQTVERMMSEIMQGAPAWKRVSELFPEIWNTQKSYGFLQSHQLQANLDSLSAAWKGFEEVFSNSANTIWLIQKVTDALHWLTREMESHPRRAAALIDLAVGLAGLSAVLGTMAVARFLVISSGIVGITRALVGLAAVNFGTIISGLSGLLGAITAFLAIMWPSPANAGEDEELKKPPTVFRHGVQNVPGLEMHGPRGFMQWPSFTHGQNPWGAASPSHVGRTPSSLVIQQLKKGALSPADFDAMYGPGASQKYLTPQEPGQLERWGHAIQRWWNQPRFGDPGQPGGQSSLGGALNLASQHMGESGSQVNGFLHANGQRINAAMAAWCAAFVNASLAAVGIQGSGSAVATSFERWGRSVPVADLRAGDILVESRGHRPGEVGGHVGFATGRTRMRNGREEVEMVSGNQGHQVSRTWEQASGIDVRRNSTQTINLNVDGRQMAHVVLDHAGRVLSGPATGPMHVDPRTVPQNPGGWS